MKLRSDSNEDGRQLQDRFDLSGPMPRTQGPLVPPQSKLHGPRSETNPNSSKSGAVSPIFAPKPSSRRAGHRASAFRWSHGRWRYRPTPVRCLCRFLPLHAAASIAGNRRSFVAQEPQQVQWKRSRIAIAWDFGSKPRIASVALRLPCPTDVKADLLASTNDAFVAHKKTVPCISTEHGTSWCRESLPFA